MKKFVLLLIAICMVITCFACRKKDEEEPVITVEPPNHYHGPWDYLFDYDFKGADFRVSTRDGYGALEVVCVNEESEYIVDVALMYRNAKVRDRYNISIVCQENDVLNNPRNSQIEQAYNDVKDETKDALDKLMAAFDALRES